MIAAPGLDASLELRARLADLYCAYGDALDDGELERWPDFFTDTCIYKIIPRENYERNLPIALIYCESRDMLADRVVANQRGKLAHYEGNVRAWRGSDVIESSALDHDGKRREEEKPEPDENADDYDENLPPAWRELTGASITATSADTMSPGRGLTAYD